MQIVSVYNTLEKLASLKSEWTHYVKRGNTFCPSGACPFLPGDKFEYDLTNFLYYRARAITADVTNLNGDLFPHLEVKSSFSTFIGKGIYFNHDSEKAEKAFGVILDAMYTPVLYDKDDYADRYVEILGAIDRRAVRDLRPGLLEDIESGKVTSTSMGTIAKKATCSICGNTAVNTETLCDHMHPQSPLYMKGRNVFGKICYETNYGLTFIEDSIVYVPADPTAHMLEVYASKNPGKIDRLAEIFLKYSSAVGRNIANSPIEITSHFTNTGGLLMEKTAATSEFKHTKDPAQHMVAPYQESIKELDEEVTDSAAKSLDNKIRRLIEEEFRKALAPILEHMDKSLRPTIKEKVGLEVAKVKEGLGQVLPGGVPALDKAISEAPAAQAEPAQQPAAGAAPAAPAKPALAPAAASVKLAYTEDFSKWDIGEKLRLVRAVAESTPYVFNGELEMPESR